MNCTNGEWPCEMSTYIASVEAENKRLKDRAHKLAMLILQSSQYEEPYIKDAVDGVLCLVVPELWKGGGA